MSDRVTAPEHARDRAGFVRYVAQQTGLDVAVVWGWTAAENGPWDNPLGIGGAPIQNLGSVQAAAKGTVDYINRLIPAGPRSSTTGSRASRISAQITAIATSRWVTGRTRTMNDPGARSYAQNIASNAVKVLLPKDSSGIDTSGLGGALWAGAKHIPGVQQGTDAVNTVVGGVTSIGDAIKWVGSNWDRVLEVMAGFILLVVGLVLLGKQVGLSGGGRSSGAGLDPETKRLVSEVKADTAGAARDAKRVERSPSKAAERAYERDRILGTKDEIPF